MRILVLDVFEHHRAADLIGAPDGIAQRQMHTLDQVLAATVIVVEVVVGPRGVRAVDDHLRRADGGADIEPLLQPPGNNGADIGILRGDGKTPERAVNAETAGVTVEKPAGALGERRPVAVQNLGLGKALQFEIAGLFEQPVPMKLDFI